MKNLTQIVCILDRSGSMQSMLTDAIGGFNSFLSSQKAIPDPAKMSVYIFDDKYETLYENIDIQEAQELSKLNYMPRGGTALRDAIGKTISTLHESIQNSEEKPEKVLIVILTDGEENSSREYSQEQISQIIKDQETNLGWQFIFLAANQDAFSTAESLGMSRGNSLNFADVSKSYESLSNVTKLYRSVSFSAEESKGDLFAAAGEDNSKTV